MKSCFLLFCCCWIISCLGDIQIYNNSELFVFDVVGNVPMVWSNTSTTPSSNLSTSASDAAVTALREHFGEFDLVAAGETITCVDHQGNEYVQECPADCHVDVLYSTCLVVQCVTKQNGCLHHHNTKDATFAWDVDAAQTTMTDAVAAVTAAATGAVEPPPLSINLATPLSLASKFLAPKTQFDYQVLCQPLADTGGSNCAFRQYSYLQTVNNDTSTEQSWRVDYFLVTGVPNGTNAQDAGVDGNRNHLRVSVGFDDQNQCSLYTTQYVNDAPVEINVCNSCSVCTDTEWNYPDTSSLAAIQVSADCTDLTNGINLPCTPLFPLVYPFSVLYHELVTSPPTPSPAPSAARNQEFISQCLRSIKKACPCRKHKRLSHACYKSAVRDCEFTNGAVGVQEKLIVKQKAKARCQK